MKPGHLRRSVVLDLYDPPFDAYSQLDSLLRVAHIGSDRRGPQRRPLIATALKRRRLPQNRQDDVTYRPSTSCNCSVGDDVKDCAGHKAR